jgi:pimeloyl-ACP methyl ester carboxylesterase
LQPFRIHLLRNRSSSERARLRTLLPRVDGAIPANIRQMKISHASSNEELKPASWVSRYAQAGALRLHYLDYGTAGHPPMLCVHGGAAHGHWYDFVAPAFTPDHHVRALDLRGHGDSPWVEAEGYAYADYVADLHAFIEALDLRELVLVGHSMGGIVSLQYAARHPQRLARLVIVDTLMRMTPEVVAGLREVGSRKSAGYATREEIVARYRLLPGSSSAQPHVLRHIAEHSVREAPDGSWTYKFDRNVFATREPYDGIPCWEHIAVPALLVKGERSGRLSDALYAEVKARCPHARRVEVADADHHVMLDNPRGFVEAVRQFLNATAT